MILLWERRQVKKDKEMLAVGHQQQAKSQVLEGVLSLKDKAKKLKKSKQNRIVDLESE